MLGAGGAGASGSGGVNGGFRPATPNSRWVVLLFLFGVHVCFVGGAVCVVQGKECRERKWGGRIAIEGF